MDDAIAKKKRKTLDDYFGVNGFLTAAIVSKLFPVLGIFSIIFGLAAGYYIFKQRHDPNVSRTKRIVQVGFLIIWLIEGTLISLLSRSS
jgi:hypothetical protein